MAIDYTPRKNSPWQKPQAYNQKLAQQVAKMCAGLG